MDPLDLLRTASRSTETVIDKIGNADRDRRTPCPEMTVQHVADHLIGGLHSFAVVGEGGEMSFGPGPSPQSADDDTGHAFRAVVDRVLAAFGEPGRLDGTYDMPWGPTTGAQLVGFELIETIVHGWDIARGLGIELAIADDVAKATLDNARQWVDDSVRVPGMFGPEVPFDGGSALNQLVAFLGRDPGWSAG